MGLKGTLKKESMFRDARSVKVSVITDSLNSTQVHVGEDTFEAVSTFQYLGDVTGESGGGAGLLKGGGGERAGTFPI